MIIGQMHSRNGSWSCNGISTEQQLSLFWKWLKRKFKVCITQFLYFFFFDVLFCRIVSMSQMKFKSRLFAQRVYRFASPCGLFLGRGMPDDKLFWDLKAGMTFTDLSESIFWGPLRQLNVVHSIQNWHQLLSKCIHPPFNAWQIFDLNCDDGRERVGERKKERIGKWTGR
jgi:hypothetical protein